MRLAPVGDPMCASRSTWNSFRVSALAIAMALLYLLSNPSIGQEAKTGSKPRPNDTDVINMVGCRLAKVFERFGVPEDFFPVDPKSKTPSVCVDYGEFGFFVQNKTVQEGLFWEEWSGSICGFKIGATPDEVVAKLGKARTVKDGDNGEQRMFWGYKVNGEVMTLIVEFKDKKAIKVVVVLD